MIKVMECFEIGNALKNKKDSYEENKLTAKSNNSNYESFKSIFDDELRKLDSGGK